MATMISSCTSLFQADPSVSDWGSMALNSSKEFHRLCEMLAMNPQIRHEHDCPDFPVWCDWMPVNYYISEIKGWSASNPRNSTILFDKLKKINKQEKIKYESRKDPKPKPKPLQKKRKRHPSGRREKRLQRLWEGEKGLKWVGETERLKSHSTHRPHRGTPHGLKWMERADDAPGEWHVYYARPDGPKKNPEKESRILWDEYEAQWVKTCGCGGDETRCSLPGFGSAPCVCFT